MKLIVAIVNNDDAHSVNTNLSKSGFFVTKIASTGGFLMSGNSTFLIGTQDEEVDHAIDIIGKYSRKRTQPTPVDISYNSAGFGTFPAEVVVGGATLFVLDVEKYVRV
ncbi:MAG: transcriptional regulator [Clostridiales bacterium]|nr:transcriptional regulator [Clostridiales bacterium]